MGMIVFVMIGCAVYVFLNILFMLLFASICNFHKAFYMNTKHLLAKLDELTEGEHIKPANFKKICPLVCEIMKNGIKGKA